MKASPTAALKLTQSDLKLIREGTNSTKAISEILRVARKAINAHAASNSIAKRNKKRAQRLLVDSGANATVIKQAKLLLKIQNRIKLAIQTALGHSTTSTGHGDLNFFVKDARGAITQFTNVGQGFKLDNLLHSLLSVSQLCDHGCTVVFKPDGAHIVTGTGETIPLEKENGLYFLPVEEGSTPLESTSTTYAVTDPMAAVKAVHAATKAKYAPLIRAGTEKAMKMLAKKGYTIRPESQCSSAERELAQEVKTLKRKVRKCLVATALRKAVIALTPRKVQNGSDRARSLENSQYVNNPNIDDLTYLENTEGVDPTLSEKDELSKLRTELSATKDKLEQAIERRLVETTTEVTKIHAREFKLARLWHLVHRSLGHASRRVTNAAVIAGNFHPAISAMQPDWFWKLKGRERLPPEHLMLCDACMRGAFVRQGADGRNATQSKHAKRQRRKPLPGEFWHGDITGPFDESREGNRFICTFVDDNSGTLFIWPTKSKADSVEAIYELNRFNEEWKLKCAEGHEMSSIKRLRTDRGGEYTSSVVGMSRESPFNVACDDLNIIQEFTSAEASSMNGKAESYNRILNDAWRCQLIDADAPIEEWDLSARAANFAINRRPCRILKNRQRADHLAEVAECIQSGKTPPPSPKDGWTTRWTKYTGLEASAQSLLPYGINGYASTGTKGRKSDLERAELVRRIGTPSNTPGHLVQDVDGTIKATVFFKPDLFKQKGGDGITDEELARQDRALADEQQRVNQAAREHETEPRNPNPPPSELRQLSDAEKRARVVSNHRQQVPLSTIGRPTPPVQSKPPPRGHNLYSPDEALRIGREAHASGNFTLQWRQDHQKTGASDIRYQQYKHCRTFAEMHRLCREGLMKGSIKGKINASGDFVCDLERGLVRLIPTTPSPTTTQHEDEDHLEPADSEYGPTEGEEPSPSSATDTEPVEPRRSARFALPDVEPTTSRRSSLRSQLCNALMIKFAPRSINLVQRLLPKIKKTGRMTNRGTTIMNMNRTRSKKEVAQIILANMSAMAQPHQPPASEDDAIPSRDDYLINNSIDSWEDTMVDYARRETMDNSSQAALDQVFGGQGDKAVKEVRANAAELSHRLKRMMTKEQGTNVNRLSRLAHACIVTGTNNPQLNHATDEFAMAAALEVVCGKVTPETLSEAKSLPEWPQWKAALKAEMDALFKMGTFEYCRRADMEPGKRTVKCKWVWKLKVNKDGSIERYKARKVVQGFRLRQGEDYYDTYSPTMSATTLRMLVAISTQTGETLSGADVGNAYLEADMDDDQIVYIEQDPEYIKDPNFSAEDYVLRLRKCLYGMPHSGRAFGQKLDAVLQKLNFRRCNADKALYHKVAASGKRIIIGTYVDDIVCMTSCEEARAEWRRAMDEAFLRVTYDDELDWMLNMEINRRTNSSGSRTTSISQRLAIERLAKSIPGIESDRKRAVPMHASTQTARRSKDAPTENEHEYSFKFASVIGALMYIANWTRPDLVTAVNRLARYMTDPTDEHYRLARELAAFAYHTKDRTLTYTETKDNPLRLSGASDSSFNDDLDHSRSTIGWGLWLGTKCSGLVKWSSKVPKTIATSSTNAEIQAATNLAKDVLWARTFLDDIGNTQYGSTVMYQDNDPAISQIQDVKGTAMSKHYLVTLRMVQELLHLGIIHMNPIDTKENVADLFTKPLSEVPFWYLSHQAIGYSDVDKYGDMLRDIGTKYVQGNGGSGKARAAAKVNPTIVNAVHAFYHGEGIDTDCPDYNITQHASTGRRYPSAHAFYSSMHGTNTRKGRGKDSNLTDCSSGGEMKLVTYT